MNWFEDLFGFQETSSYSRNRDFFSYDQETTKLKSLRNGRSFHVGPFETPANSDLKGWLHDINSSFSDEINYGMLTFKHINGNVQNLMESNHGAVFQVASQFNCLEMVDPSFSPEDGVTNYCNDHTQGPASALSCPAATVFRNYFVNGLGQGDGHQIDLLSDVGRLLRNNSHAYWEMINGYCLLCKKDSLVRVTIKLQNNDTLKNECYGALRVGINWDTEVTMKRKREKNNKGQRVCQIFCSALPVAYWKTPAHTIDNVSIFAKLVLDSAYDSTLTAAHLLALRRSSRVTVFLTFLGGGVFGNHLEWVASAIEKAINLHRHAPLDVKLVHYPSHNRYFDRIQLVNDPIKEQPAGKIHLVNAAINGQPIEKPEFLQDEVIPKKRRR